LEGEKVVVDASVVVKWFVEEEYSKEALMLRDSYADGVIDLIAPSLLCFEVVNALKYSGAFGEDELKEVLRALDDYQITLFDLEGGYGEKAIEIAMRKGVTMYDAAEYLKRGSRIERVIFCLYDDETYRIFSDELERIRAELV